MKTLTKTQSHFLAMTINCNGLRSIPRPTANVLQRLGLIEWTGRTGSVGEGAMWTATDAGRERGEP